GALVRHRSRRRFLLPEKPRRLFFRLCKMKMSRLCKRSSEQGRKEVTSSSDDVEDKLESEQFSRKYQEMHRLVQEPDGSTLLYIGAENWPFPIPLVSKNGAWHFDSETGTQEIKFRRIGENEATAIAVCEEFAMAKNEADAKAASEDPITRFAQSLASAANADNKESNPFHGYYFRIVTENS